MVVIVCIGDETWQSRWRSILYVTMASRLLIGTDEFRVVWSLSNGEVRRRFRAMYDRFIADVAVSEDDLIERSRKGMPLRGGFLRYLYGRKDDRR